MKFKTWYFIGKFGCVLFILSGLWIIAGDKSLVIRVAGGLSLLILIVLGMIGAVMGIFLSLGKLKMKCPFCNQYGFVGADKKNGMWMECNACGLIHGSGCLGLKLKAGQDVSGQCR